MLLILIAIAALALSLLTIKTVRSHSVAIDKGGTRAFHRVDTQAFQNLLSQEDDEYLRKSLTEVDYRRVRRARVRAVQEYLMWMAEDCATLTTLLRMAANETSPQLEAMAREAIRLRLTSLGLWSLLWIEYVIPALAFRPTTTLEAYERFRRSAETLLARTPQTAIAAGRA